MSARIDMPLPAPHDSIYVECERHGWGIFIEYRAPSLAALVAAGCITQAMREQLNVPDRGRGRVDADGDGFHRRKRPLKSQPERCEVTRFIHTDREHDGEAKAMALPGVAAFLAQLEVGTRSRMEVAAERVSEALDATFTLPRMRAIGRFQRRVQWIAAGDVIFPDWPSVRALAIADRQGAA
jgi:hypothetical protein